MRKTQNKHTLQDITQYIKVANRDGVLQESMMTIARNTGYSNATVHRALQTLEERGVITLQVSDSGKDPTKIFYHGPGNEETVELLQRATYAMTEMSQAMKNMSVVMEDLRHHMMLTVDQPHRHIH